MGSIWPYIQPSIQPGSSTVYYNYTTLTETQIRQVIREELQQALHPEQIRPSATVEYTMMDGKRYKGTVYLVEEEEDGDEDE